MASAPTETEAGAGLPRRGPSRPGVALAVIATAQLMVVLDATIVNIALPHIRAALDFSQTGLAWVLNAYTLVFGGLLLLGGRSGDVFGRRRMFVIGVCIFALASLLGGWLPPRNSCYSPEPCRAWAAPLPRRPPWPWSPPHSQKARSATGPSASTPPFRGRAPPSG